MLNTQDNPDSFTPFRCLRMAAPLMVAFTISGTSYAGYGPTPKPFLVSTESASGPGPTTPDEAEVYIYRGGKSTGSSLDDLAVITFAMGSSGEDVGYDFIVTGGASPARLAGGPYQGPEVSFGWVEGAPLEAFDFKVEVWTVDRQGRRSASSLNLDVRNDGIDQPNLETEAHLAFATRMTVGVVCFVTLIAGFVYVLVLVPRRDNLKTRFWFNGRRPRT